MAKIYPKLANCHIHVKRLKLASKGLKIASSQKIAPIHFYYWRIFPSLHKTVSALRLATNWHWPFKTVSKILVTWFKFLDIFNLKMAVRQRILEQYDEVWEKLNSLKWFLFNSNSKLWVNQASLFLQCTRNKSKRSLSITLILTYILSYVLTYIYLYILIYSDLHLHIPIYSELYIPESKGSHSIRAL